LHDFYTADGKLCPVFPRERLVCEDGFPLRRGTHRALPANAWIGRRLRSPGASKVTWAYVLSGVVSLALLVYLVIALIRAEDL
jgi:K+-transporting ATPase KdpF subunit